MKLIILGLVFASFASAQIIEVDYACGRSSNALYTAFENSAFLDQQIEKLQNDFQVACDKPQMIKEIPYCDKMVATEFKCFNDHSTLEVKLIANVKKSPLAFFTKELSLNLKY